jgi:hypothetical protein
MLTEFMGYNRRVFTQMLQSIIRGVLEGIYGVDQERSRTQVSYTMQGSCTKVLE